MAISAETPLLGDAVSSAVDRRGVPAVGYSSGGWRSAGFIIGVEVAERFAFYGIGSNLISYLTGPIGQSTAVAAANVNAWSGTALVLSVFGAFIADAFLGRYRTIVVASVLYIMGLGLLTLSAFLIPSSTLSNQNTHKAAAASPLVKTLFFFSLYLVAIGQGGHKPCVQAFGADQFDKEDPAESKARSSFFNWWYLSFSMGINLALLIVVYIQDNLGWALGFGIPCIFMVISLLIFLLGKSTYRYTIKQEERNPFARIGNVFVAAFRNRKLTLARSSEEDTEQANPSQKCPERFKLLNKALITPDASVKHSKLCNIKDVEEAKALLGFIPIWITTLAYGIPYAQSTTFFTKQGSKMDRRIFPGLEIPAASLQLFIGISIVLFVPIYDRMFVPIARAISHKPSGITMLQRIGSGMLLSSLTMVVAALIETKRLSSVQEELGHIDQPMSIWWLVPQYLMFGLTDVLTLVGMQEFFYDQVPTELRSMGLALYLSSLGVGSFLSGWLVTVIDRATGGDSGDGWFNSDLNRAHLNYFYWLLAAVSAVGFLAFLYFSKLYVYNNRTGRE